MLRKEPEYKKNQKSAEEHRNYARYHKENIGAILAVTTVVDRMVNQKTAENEKAERHEDGKKNRENTMIGVIGVTAIVALLTLVVTHRDTSKIITEAKIGSYPLDVLNEGIGK